VISPGAARYDEPEERSSMPGRGEELVESRVMQHGTNRNVERHDLDDASLCSRHHRVNPES
jgi:hypothetical protein